MKFMLVIAIYSRLSGLSLETHSRVYTGEECQTMAAIYEAQNTNTTAVKATCVGFQP